MRPANEIEKEIEAYNDELRPVNDAIAATRAATLDGLLVKARAIRWLYREDPEQLLADAGCSDDELMRSITVDLWAMQEGDA